MIIQAMQEECNINRKFVYGTVMGDRFGTIQFSLFKNAKSITSESVHGSSCLSSAAIDHGSRRHSRNSMIYGFIGCRASIVARSCIWLLSTCHIFPPSGCLQGSGLSVEPSTTFLLSSRHPLLWNAVPPSRLRIDGRDHQIRHP